jgi:hypothetical protein
VVEEQGWGSGKGKTKEEGRGEEHGKGVRITGKGRER